MNMHAALIVGLGLIVAGCADEGPADSAPAEQAEASMTGDAAMPATGGETEAAALAPWEADDSWRNAGFMQHMHLHADRLDEVNFALADDDLEAAMEPAEWLATHETYEDIQTEWLEYVYRMRSEAEDLVAATDLATARAAAKRINDQCQACHTFLGIATFGSE